MRNASGQCYETQLLLRAHSLTWIKILSAFVHWHEGYGTEESGFTDTRELH